MSHRVPTIELDLYLSKRNSTINLWPPLPPNTPKHTCSKKKRTRHKNAWSDFQVEQCQARGWAACRLHHCLHRWAGGYRGTSVGCRPITRSQRKWPDCTGLDGPTVTRESPTAMITKMVFNYIDKRPRNFFLPVDIGRWWFWELRLTRLTNWLGWLWSHAISLQVLFFLICFLFICLVVFGVVDALGGMELECYRWWSTCLTIFVTCC